MVIRVLTVYPHDHVGDRELWFIAASQYHKRILYCVLLAWERVKVQNLKYGFY